MSAFFAAVKLAASLAMCALGPLADRIMAALEAGQNAGGDRRGKISAAIVVHNEAPGTSGYARNIDLRVDSSKDPVGELRTLFDAYKAAFKIK